MFGHSALHSHFSALCLNFTYFTNAFLLSALCFFTAAFALPSSLDIFLFDYQ